MDAASRYSAILDPDTLVSMIPEREDPSDPTEGLAHDIARFHILLASGSDLTGNSGIAA
ncbi:MAG TPA: hypothetical protein PK765_04815 [bacterium]|nr:hypothetical protein [bacterium]